MGENLLLVKAIEKYPCLYNHNSVEYLKKESTEEAWNEVAKEMKLTVTECKEKWKNLRYGFIRSLRPNPDGSTKKKYYLHDEMEFVLPFLKPTSGSAYVYLQGGDFDTDEELIENNRDLYHQSPVNAIEIDEPPKKRAKLQNESKAHGNSSLGHNTFISNNMENPRMMFLLSILPEVNEFSESQMKMFRRKVLALIDDITEAPSHYVNVLCELEKDRSQFQNDSIKSEPL